MSVLTFYSTTTTNNLLLDMNINELNLKVGSLHRVCNKVSSERNGKEMFYLMTHSTHFIYSYMASDIW